MKFLGVFVALTIAWSAPTYAVQEGFELQYVKPLIIKIFGRDKKGVVKQEYPNCTPQTCCFSERFYCFMERGRCICDLHRCEMWPDKKDEKRYWMEISGTEAERYCGRPRKLHELTNLCLCDPDKTPPCNECNPPVVGCGRHLNPSLPPDCRP